MLSRDGARIRRILAACPTLSGNAVRTRRVLTASGKSPISRNVGRTQRVLILPTVPTWSSPVRNVGFDTIVDRISRGAPERITAGSLIARGTSSSSRNDERHIASFEPRASAAVRPVVVLVRRCHAGCRHCRQPIPWRPRRHASGPMDRRSLAVVGPRRQLPDSDCCESVPDRLPTCRQSYRQTVTAITMREPAAPSLRASPGERRAPELAAHSAANVRGRRVGGR